MLYHNKKINIVFGERKIHKNVFKIFDKNIVNFFSALSEEILKNRKARMYSDLISYGFWIRKKNINKINSDYFNNEVRRGHGLAFHITPSNIPLNFAYSFTVSLLAGNSNIIRISSKDFEQNKIFFYLLRKVLKNKKFHKIKASNYFITYEYDDNITKYFSEMADCRILWGSDKTIKSLKKIETNPLCKDIFFPDRYSISMININKIKNLKKEEFKKLLRKFYIDSMMYDQNACTSPHLIIWIGKKNKAVSSYFWNELDNLIKKEQLFQISEKKIYDKYSKICELSSERMEIKKNYKINFLILTELKKIPQDIFNFRIGNGFFFEYYEKKLCDLKINFGKKIQTLTYFGFNKSQIKRKLNDESFNSSIDRIVPVGMAIDFNNIWDGIDLIRALSKITYIH